MEWVIEKLLTACHDLHKKDSRGYVWREKRMKHFGELGGNGEFDANRWIVYVSVFLVFHRQGLKSIHSV